ncbi:MAG: hypothetical protein JWQ74_3542 [Marmoricola sp.]|nr:hypothetical protein [Marmoricola sp.]
MGLFITLLLIVLVCIGFVATGFAAVWIEARISPTFRRLSRAINDDSTYGPIDLTKDGRGDDYRFRGRL